MTISFSRPACLLKATAKDLDDDLQKTIQDWIDKFPTLPLLLTGEPGRGKSYIASAIYEYLVVYKRHEGFFVSVPYLFQIWLANMLDHSKNLDLLNQLTDCKCLVLDDLGLRKPSDGFLDFLYCIIDKRASSLSDFTVYTTNCNSKELTELYSARIVSRLAYGKTLKIEGKDRRKENKAL